MIMSGNYFVVHSHSDFSIDNRVKSFETYEEAKTRAVELFNTYKGCVYVTKGVLKLDYEMKEICLEGE